MRIASCAGACSGTDGPCNVLQARAPTIARLQADNCAVSVYAMPFKLVLQRTQRYAQVPRGRRTVSSHCRQSVKNDVFFKLIDQCRQVLFVTVPGGFFR
mgnify:CR=1 FL=1